MRRLTPLFACGAFFCCYWYSYVHTHIYLNTGHFRRIKDDLSALLYLRQPDISPQYGVIRCNADTYNTVFSAEFNAVFKAQSIDMAVLLRYHTAQKCSYTGTFRISAHRFPI